MIASRRALTRVELAVVILIVGFLLLIFLIFSGLPWHARRGEIARTTQCKANLKDVGKAMAAYREDNGGYFPFSWQRAGEPEPEGTGAANAMMAATSLGDLYPRYVQKATLFRCPSTEGWPRFVLNLPSEHRGSNAIALRTLPEGSNWTLTPMLAGDILSYGYDPRVSPRAPAGDAMLADMDGSGQVNPDSPTQNHIGGQNVLYVDGHVRWRTSNFCSNDLNDNIFAQDNWDADTDSYLVDTDTALSVSFDGYKHLHYPAKPKPPSEAPVP
jgi:prepilin-type processing-associated H-X9-DG protein